MARIPRIPLLSARGNVHSAGGTPFDVAELLGMAAALVLSAAVANGPWLALALGAASAVPFMARRARRGLRPSEGGPLP